jgi:hypothetical protein
MLVVLFIILAGHHQRPNAIKFKRRSIHVRCTVVAHHHHNPVVVGGMLKAVFTPPPWVRAIRRGFALAMVLAVGLTLFAARSRVAG